MIYHFNMTKAEAENKFKKIYNDGGFKFSYSSLNRLKFSPKLFYKDYILYEKEIKTDKHLIEGKLLHMVLLQPENLLEEFSIVPGKIPSDAVRRVLKEVKDNLPGIPNSGDPEVEQNYEEPLLDDLDVYIITALKHQNLYQSMKDDSKKLAKIQTADNEEYFKFLCTQEGKDIIDNDMLAKAHERVTLIKENKEISDLINPVVTDFEMDDVTLEREVYNEQYLTCTLKDLKFGLKGYVDKYIIDHQKRTITIIDLKTSGKSIAQFSETVEFYNYWLQAAIYTMLVIKNVEEGVQGYEIKFNFIVIDTYGQVYNFEVIRDTMQKWGAQMLLTLDAAKYHCDNMNFTLPYDFLNNKVVL